MVEKDGIVLPEPPEPTRVRTPFLEFWWGPEDHRYGVDTVEGWKLTKNNKRIKSAEIQLSDGTELRMRIPEEIVASPLLIRWMYDTLREWHVEAVTRRG